MNQRISVAVRAGVKIGKIEQVNAGQFKIWVTAVPEKGRANEAVRKALADYIHIAITKLVLVYGQKAKNKVFEILP